MEFLREFKSLSQTRRYPINTPANQERAYKMLIKLNIQQSDIDLLAQMKSPSFVKEQRGRFQVCKVSSKSAVSKMDTFDDPDKCHLLYTEDYLDALVIFEYYALSYETVLLLDTSAANGCDFAIWVYHPMNWGEYL